MKKFLYTLALGTATLYSFPACLPAVSQSEENPQTETVETQLSTPIIDKAIANSLIASQISIKRWYELSNQAFLNITSSKPQYQPAKSVADQIHDNTLTNYNLIEKLKNSLGLNPNAGNTSGWYDPTNTKAEIEQLESALTEFGLNNKKALQDLAQTSPGFSYLMEEVSALEQKLPSLKVESITHDLCKIDAYTYLQTLQTNLLIHEISIQDLLLKESSELQIVYDKFQIWNTSKNPIVLKGETYEAEIGIGAISSQAQIAVAVNGRSLPVKDGKAIYSQTASQMGKQNYTASVTITNPLTGMTERVTKEFSYQTTVPSVSAVADKMNVIYVGIENPLSIAAAGVASSNLKVSVTGGGAALSQSGAGHYMLTASKPGQTVVVTVTDLSKGRTLAKFNFRTKRIPTPVATLGGETNRTFAVKSGEFKAQMGLTAVLPDFDFDAPCSITAFSMTYTPKRQDPVTMQHSGGKFSGQVLNTVQNAKPGDLFIFHDVKCKCPGYTANAKTNGLSFMIK